MKRELFSPLTTAIKGKGISALLRRARVIGRRYGLTTSRMDLALSQFVELLGQYDCEATFPITGVALSRDSAIVRAYQSQGIEFAIHGHTHVDHSALSLDEQMAQLAQARSAFEQHGVRVNGFRCPYLRWNADTLTALQQHGLAYDSSQALAWDVVHGLETEAYQRVLDFYSAQAAADYPALPRLADNLVHIPYCVPDDEALVERLQLTDTGPMSEVWLEILNRTYELGGLFTLGLHPERFALCAEPLRAVLSRARALSPPVWIARLGEIAAWWRDRTATTVDVEKVDGGALRLSVTGPPGTTILARGVDVVEPAEPWGDGYYWLKDTASATVHCERRPFIGVSPDSPPDLADFLRQQGYIVQTATDARSCTLYLDQAEFSPTDELPLLAQIENDNSALVRLGRWPYGARSALAVSGDIDALTIWDYGLRFLGK